jgi:hypothetical protein
MKGGTGLVCLIVVLAVAGCAPIATDTCKLPGQRRSDALRLYFGRDIPGGGSVSDADWSVFAAEVLTPAFPEGFSVYQVMGQWRASDGSIVREPSFVVERIGMIDPARLAAVTAAYRTRFRQEAVGIVSAPVCAAF